MKTKTAETFTEKQVIAILRKEQKSLSASITEYAERIGIGKAYLCDLFAGRKTPGPAILKYLKMEKVFRMKA